MHNVRVVGRFTAAGGGFVSRNDIRAVITDEDDFENWKNGHQAKALYATPSWITVGTIDCPSK
jgi:hypothetical protein